MRAKEFTVIYQKFPTAWILGDIAQLLFLSMPILLGFSCFSVTKVKSKN